MAPLACSSVDARTALVQASTNRLEVWDIPKERLLAALATAIDPTSRHAHLVSRDNRFLYEASLVGQTGRLWDLGSTQLLHIARLDVGVHNSFVMAFSHDNRLLARPRPDGIELYDIRAGRPLRTVRTFYSTGAVAFSPDGRILATGNGNGVIVSPASRPAG